MCKPILKEKGEEAESGADSAPEPLMSRRCPGEEDTSFTVKLRESGGSGHLPGARAL